VSVEMVSVGPCL